MCYKTKPFHDFASTTDPGGLEVVEHVHSSALPWQDSTEACQVENIISKYEIQHGH